MYSGRKAEGDVFTCVIDFTDPQGGNVSFIRNGAATPVYTARGFDVSQSFRFAVCMFNAGTKVTLLTQ